MIWSIAWKNVWRNRKRSLIVIASVMLGTTAGVFTTGLIIGWCDQRVQVVIHTEDAHMKVHNPAYLNNEDIVNTIPQADSVCRYLDGNPLVKAYSKRIKLMAMAATSRGNTALILQGIDVEKEKKVSDLYKQLLPDGGRFFEQAGSYPIVISEKTAENLKIKSFQLTEDRLDSLRTKDVPEDVIQKLGPILSIRYNTKNLFRKAVEKYLSKREANTYAPDLLKASEHFRLRSKIVFTFTDKHGELVNQSFRVCGIFHTSNTMFDQMNAFVYQDELAKLTGLGPTEFHEIGVLLKDDAETLPVQNDLKRRFSKISVLNWLQLAPDASFISQYIDLYNYIILGFILFALAFGIINTMLMAVLERTKELGMLMAIGMNHKRVFGMILLETVFLTLVGAVIGMVLGWLSILITGHTGLDFSSVGEGFEAMGWPAIVYPRITADYFIGITLLVILAGILSSLIPARKALKLNPVEAIRTDN